MKKFLVILSSAVVVLSLFTVVTYANDWLMFNEQDELNQSTSDENEIISLLEGVQQGKESAEKDLEDALIKLKNLQGLDGEVEKLNVTISLKDHTIKGLKAETTKLQGELDSKIIEVSDKQKEIDNKNNELNEKIGYTMNYKQSVIDYKRKLIATQIQRALLI